MMYKIQSYKSIQLFLCVAAVVQVVPVEVVCECVLGVGRVKVRARVRGCACGHQSPRH